MINKLKHNQTYPSTWPRVNGTVYILLLRGILRGKNKGHDIKLILQKFCYKMQQGQLRLSSSMHSKTQKYTRYIGGDNYMYNLPGVVAKQNMEPFLQSKYMEPDIITPEISYCSKKFTIPIGYDLLQIIFTLEPWFSRTCKID